jgi:hypothetical protein
MDLNADVPEIQCFLRKEYLYNVESHHGEFVPCVIIGCSSVPGRAIGFHALTENGAMIWRLPISAFCHKKEAPVQELGVLELWDSFSEKVSVHLFQAIREMRVRTLLKDGEWYDGKYLFTIDWWGSSASDNPGDWGHKCAHVLQLDNGNYAAQPNNRVQWRDQAFVTDPFKEKPDYKTNQQIWKCEDGLKWKTENSDSMFYDGKGDNDGTSQGE